VARIPQRGIFKRLILIRLLDRVQARLFLLQTTCDNFQLAKYNATIALAGY
jgi:hypothetical protein